MRLLNTALIAGLAPFLMWQPTFVDASDRARHGAAIASLPGTTRTADAAVYVDETANDDYSNTSVDDNEITHLSFLREEEKLARDVYLTLGDMWPQARVFVSIAGSEQTHTDAVRDMLEKYGLPDPSVSDAVGVFTGPDFGWYFTNKYDELVLHGSQSELEALYVGAFIEELDMVDIQLCPDVIVDGTDDVDDSFECAATYTDNPDLQQLYTNLLEGSKNHLRAFVGSIEKIIGEGKYEAQVITQEEVDAILGR